MTRLAHFAALATFALAIGCGSDTGLIVEVTRGEGAQGLTQIDALEFYVGTDARPGVDVYVPDPEEKRIELNEERDLLLSPFRLLLEVGDFGDRDVFNTNVVVAVIAYRGTEPIAYGLVDEPVRFVDGEVRKYTVVLDRSGDRFFPDENGCLTLILGDEVVQLGSEDDKDCDGDLVADDCNDLDPSVGPSQQETCENNIDEDCDDEVDEISDDDRDGVTNCDGDCDDRNAAVNPDADEVCDSIDNNCNGACDEAFDDEDGDGYLRECASVVRQDGSCRPNPPYAEDCDDEDPNVHPEKDDPCDGIDNNCNYFCDENVGPSEDPDGDGFATCGGASAGLTVQSRPGRACLADADCDPNDQFIYPGAPELCDGRDNDCDIESIFEGATACLEGDGQCLLGTADCDDTVGGAGPGLCGVGNAVNLGQGVCAGADTCLQDPDPLVCTLIASGPKVVGCTVHFLVEDDGVSLCPNTQVLAPSTGLVGECSWTLVAQRGPYDFAVPGSDGPPTPTVGLCNAVLQIEDFLGGGGFGKAFMFGSIEPDPMAGGLHELVYSPVGVAVCPERAVKCDPPWDRPLN